MIKQHICDISVRNRAIESVVFSTGLTKNNTEINASRYIRQSILRFTKEEKTFIIDNIRLKKLGEHIPKQLVDTIHAIMFYQLSGMQSYY